MEYEVGRVLSSVGVIFWVDGRYQFTFRVTKWDLNSGASRGDSFSGKHLEQIPLAF